MARIRTIKPDAFTSESLSAISVLARWTFVGLLTYLDDWGMGRADTRLIKAALFPLDDTTSRDDVDRALSELIDAGCIHTYQSGGSWLGNWRSCGAIGPFFIAIVVDVGTAFAAELGK